MRVLAWIKSIAQELVNRYSTTNPYELASCLNIEVISWDLHEEIRGFYKFERRNKFIVINNNLDDDLKRIVCAHELGHAILHPRANTPFMKKHTLLSVEKIELEANSFAAHLLIPDESLFNYYEQTTIYDIASLHNVPFELVELKCKGLF